MIAAFKLCASIRFLTPIVWGLDVLQRCFLICAATTSTSAPIFTSSHGKQNILWIHDIISPPHLPMRGSRSQWHFQSKARPGVWPVEVKQIKTFLQQCVTH